MIEKRVKEAEKMGFKTCIIPKSNKKLLKDNFKMDIIGVRTINEAMQKAGLRQFAPKRASLMGELIFYD